MKIQFIGAANEVTGSCTLLTVSSKYYLIDCGMEQGIDVFQNVKLPISPSEVEAVFLTHAHIDHSGMLPKLYKDGFRGKIYSTEATARLASIMLRDSAHIQMSEAEWKSRKSKRSGEEDVEPTYNMEDAEGAIALFVGIPYGKKVEISESISIRFTDIGHLLGSAAIEIWMREGNLEKKIVFSGDVGNVDQPIINDPTPICDADYVVMESTYGNRVHDRPEDTVVSLAKYIDETISAGGNVIIPSFAIGRTQEMLYAIREIKERSLTSCGDFPVYVDSPLAVEATNIFASCPRECMDPETRALVDKGVNPISFPSLRLSVSVEDSRFINTDTVPKVILSASGMCEAGRIKHHLKHNLWKSQNLILFVGYQSEGSLGRALQEGVKKIKLFGEEIVVRAKIRSLKGTSGHADRNGLIGWLSGFEKKPKTVFLNHGTEESINDLARDLKDMGYAVEAPFSGTEYDLARGIMTVFSESRPINDNAYRKSKTEQSRDKVILAAEELLKIAKRADERTNKENANLTSQIRALIAKWEL